MFSWLCSLCSFIRNAFWSHSFVAFLWFWPTWTSRVESLSKSTLWRYYCNCCRNRVKLLVQALSSRGWSQTPYVLFTAFSLFTFHQPCFYKSSSNWMRWMFLWNLIFIVIVKRFSYFLLIKKMFSKKDQTLCNITRHKAGKNQTMKYLRTCLLWFVDSTFNLMTSIIKSPVSI